MQSQALCRERRADAIIRGLLPFADQAQADAQDIRERRWIRSAKLFGAYEIVLTKKRAQGLLMARWTDSGTARAPYAIYDEEDRAREASGDGKKHPTAMREEP
jgi:hypothetical protein